MRQPSPSKAVAASATPARRNSIGSRLLSAAYLSRNAMPKNSTMMPTRTTVLPPSSQSRPLLKRRSARPGPRGGVGGDGGADGVCAGSGSVESDGGSGEPADGDNAGGLCG